jgi:hypothetical protein
VVESALAQLLNEQREHPGKFDAKDGNFDPNALVAQIAPAFRPK